MNVLVNTCNKIWKIYPNLQNNGHYVMREFTKLSDVGINWHRPVKISYTSPEKSGDLGLDIDIKPTEYCVLYANSPELSDADENVKKLFTLRFQHGKESNFLRKVKVLNLVRRHDLDWGSPEAKIAKMTNRIQILQERRIQFPMNKQLKVELKELIDQRQKMLKFLRKWDYKRFEWVLEKLNLVYKPHPQNDVLPQRKLSLRKITDAYCEKIIKDKLDEYKALLESQKKDFYKQKVEEYTRIRQEQLELGLEPIVSEEELELARKQAEAYQ